LGAPVDPATYNQTFLIELSGHFVRYVRFWPKAEIGLRGLNVCFGGKAELNWCCPKLDFGGIMFELISPLIRAG
jgi:hypothetical protein